MCHPPSTWMYSSTQKLSQLCIFGFFFLMEASFHRLPCGSAGKEYPCNAEDLGSIPGLGRSPGEGKGYPLQYSCLENSMDCVVHGVTKSQTQLSDFHFQFSGSESFGAEIQKVNIFRGPLCRRPLTRRPWTYSAIILDT